MVWLSTPPLVVTKMVLYTMFSSFATSTKQLLLHKCPFLIAPMMMCMHGRAQSLKTCCTFTPTQAIGSVWLHRRSSHPSPLPPHHPRALPKLHQLSQPSDEHSIQPQQSKIEQITTSTLQPQRRSPILQHIEALPSIVYVFRADEQVQEERRDEGEVCAGIWSNLLVAVPWLV